MIETVFFKDVVLVVVAALLGGAVATWLRQPLFVGYVIGGLLVNPFTPGPAVQDVATFQLFAQIGVILLMFTIGMEMTLRELTRAGPPALFGAPVMAVLTIGLAVAAGAALHWPLAQAAAVGIVIANSSSMVAAKLLLERGAVNSPHGHVVLGTTLMEDLLTVVLIVVLPILARGETGRLGATGLAVARAAAILIPFLFLANRVIPRLLARVARQRNTELFIIVAMAIAVGTAALSAGLGLSLALGAFLAGLVISESDEFTHEILTRVLPLRDLFSALFFVSVGTLIRPRDLLAAPWLLVLVVALILGGKFVLRLLTLRLFRLPLNMGALVSVHLAQTGEFTFVMAQVALTAGLLSQGLYQAVLAASLVSILVISFISDLAHRWIEVPTPRFPPPGEAEREAGRVLVCGFGRVGGTIGEALEAFRIPFTVIDLNPQVVEALRQRGIPVVYGDAAGEPVLRSAGAERAVLAVVATPDFERTRLAVRRLRQLNPTVPILARSTRPGQRPALIAAGASEVIQPEFEAAQTLIRHGLEQLGIPHEQIKEYMAEQRAAAELSAGRAPQLPLHHLLEATTVRIGPGFCADRSLRQARIRERTGVTVLTVRRADGDEVINPGPDVVLRPGDLVTIIGLPEQITLFERLNQEAD
ncbi:MAG: cation:proton antiporter [Armatimonadota bacterium]|nr:cation:proton antiporter [Armatimonadota bacterium]MDR7451012.1 cation:proton antiporter [Armatimonadota bacterium]MDR7465967.1 cation:proton antiporter [Armatimonadota bacterium]MDR7494032.1 cation:proton antiporter [Armatimonadota bacterium]MDR7498482.1 cation:proton antiporter [Armatimonadota bacterium]